jgi:hypothetical protein
MERGVKTENAHHALRRIAVQGVRTAASSLQAAA